LHQAQVPSSGVRAAHKVLGVHVLQALVYNDVVKRLGPFDLTICANALNGVNTACANTFSTAPRCHQSGGGYIGGFADVYVVHKNS
jgi:hypothetical protein